MKDEVVPQVLSVALQLVLSGPQRRVLDAVGLLKKQVSCHLPETDIKDLGFCLFFFFSFNLCFTLI